MDQGTIPSSIHILVKLSVLKVLVFQKENPDLGTFECRYRSSAKQQPSLQPAQLAPDQRTQRQDQLAAVRPNDTGVNTSTGG